MKSVAYNAKRKIIALAAAILLTACATQAPAPARDYSCTDYNAARARLAAKPANVTLNDLYQDPEVLRFLKINLVGFKASLGKHPTSAEAMRLIDDGTDAQALQCRLAPKAVVKYTAQQVTPGSVLLGYTVDYTAQGGQPAAVENALASLRLGKPVADEPGMFMAKQFIQNCAAKAGPAVICKLGNL